MTDANATDADSANAPAPANLETCAICRVKIQKMIGGDRVVFAFGPPGTRETLWTKVCQHVKDDIRCINKNSTLPPQR